MSTISLNSVRKSFGKTEVIHGIDVEVADGEFIVIVGPSGCGKSTLLRMVAGLETVTDGDVAIDGNRVNDMEPMERNIAMVFQNYALYPHISVFDNMAYGLKIAGMPKAEIAERVQTAAKMLQLEDYLTRMPRHLSGGQRQRVAMGRAIVRKPAIFLFDEPLSNLDAKLRVQMRLEIKQLQRSLGTTSLYVTHDQVEAMTLADRLIVMNTGVADQIDTPMHVYKHPASIFVAGFIGSPSMNFLPAKIESDGSTVSLESGANVRAEGLARSKHAGRGVTIGIRPEHLEMTSPDRADLTLQIAAIETLGADTLVHGSIAGTGMGEKRNAGFAARLPGNARITEGESLPLRVADGALHLFDRQSEKRIAEI